MTASFKEKEKKSGMGPSWSDQKVAAKASIFTYVIFRAERKVPAGDHFRESLRIEFHGPAPIGHRLRFGAALGGDGPLGALRDEKRALVIRVDDSGIFHFVIPL